MRNFCGALKRVHPARVREVLEVARRRAAPIPGKKAERLPVPQRTEWGARRCEPAEVRGREPERVLESQQQREPVRARVENREQSLVRVPVS